jgi:hypothetical protein
MSGEYASSETEALLLQRYGRRSQVGWKFVALIISIFGIPWLIWSAWNFTNPPYKVTVISYETLDDSRISLAFAFSRRDETQDFTCNLIAEDFDRNIVGEIEYPIPGGVKETQIKTEIPTRIRPVAASVPFCQADSKPRK